jgi:hypothetical protein
MAETISLQDPPDFSLVLGGPLYQIFRRTRLTGPALESLRRRIIFFVILYWFPLAIPFDQLIGQIFKMLF